MRCFRALGGVITDHNGDGLRVAQAVNGVGTRFACDQVAALPRVVATSSGPMAHYLFKPGLLGVQQGGRGTPCCTAVLGLWTAADAVVGSASDDLFGGVALPARLYVAVGLGGGVSRSHKTQSLPVDAEKRCAIMPLISMNRQNTLCHSRFIHTA